MSTSEKRNAAGQPKDRAWSEHYRARKGIGVGAFEQRLARARMIHLRRRELAWHWLALAVLIGCWDVAGRLDEAPMMAQPAAAATDTPGSARLRAEKHSALSRISAPQHRTLGTSAGFCLG